MRLRIIRAKKISFFLLTIMPSMTFDYHMQMPYTQINTRSVSRPVKAVYMPLSIDIK